MVEGTGQGPHLGHAGGVVVFVVIDASRAEHRVAQGGDGGAQPPGPPVRQGQALEGSPYGGGVVGVLVLADVVAVTGAGAQGQLRGHGVAFGHGDQQPGQVQHGRRRVAGCHSDRAAEASGRPPSHRA
ncbi:MAG TPA: hypothetical protein VG253_18985 [Streptosporangiaceae bacterium]|nr:hypothetical protein [Streptosporangiaceae bacterium]